MLKVIILLLIIEISIINATAPVCTDDGKTTGAKCTKCSTNCAECSSATVCTTCSPKYYIDANKACA